MKRANRIWPALVAMAIIILATALRAYHIGDQSLWNDEGSSAAMVGRTPAEIAEAAIHDIHPPLYYWFLAGWGSLAGISELALRLPSAIFGVLTAAIVIWLGRHLFGRTAGWIAGTLVAISPFQVYYGQEARMYALLALLSAASILFTVQVLNLPGEMVAGRFKRGHALGIVVGYIVTNAAGLYTHYTFPFVIAAETFIFVIWLIRRRRKMHGLMTWLGLQAMTFLLFAPLLPTAIQQLQSWPRLTSNAVEPPAIARAIVYGTTLAESQAGLGLMAMILLAVLGLLMPPTRERLSYLTFAERAGLAALWLVVPLGATLAQGVIREPTLKFLLPCNLAMMVLAARGAALGIDIPRGASILTRLLTPVMLVIGMYPALIGLNNLYNDPFYARDNYRAIAQRITAEAGSEAAVILVGPSQSEVFTYYYPDGPGITPLPDATPVKTAVRLIETYPRVYAILWGSEEQDPQSKVETALNNRAFLIDTTWYGNVRLAAFAPLNDGFALESLSEALFGNPPVAILRSFAVTRFIIRPGDVIGVQLNWEVLGPVPEHLTVFVHLLVRDGALIAQHDGEPRGGLSPSISWNAGDNIVDRHGLTTATDLPAGEYQLGVGLYDEAGMRLSVTDKGGNVTDTLIIVPITVEP